MRSGRSCPDLIPLQSECLRIWSFRVVGARVIHVSILRRINRQGHIGGYQHLIEGTDRQLPMVRIIAIHFRGSNDGRSCRTGNELDEVHDAVIATEQPVIQIDGSEGIDVIDGDDIVFLQVDMLQINGVRRIPTDARHQHKQLENRLIGDELDVLHGERLPIEHIDLAVLDDFLLLVALQVELLGNTTGNHCPDLGKHIRVEDAFQYLDVVRLEQDQLGDVLEPLHQRMIDHDVDHVPTEHIAELGVGGIQHLLD